MDLKNQGKKSAKTRKLGFLKNDCAWGEGDSRKPTKNQGENQGGRKPSVLVGFLRQKKGLCIPSQGAATVVAGVLGGSFETKLDSRGIHEDDEYILLL